MRSDHFVSMNCKKHRSYTWIPPTSSFATQIRTPLNHPLPNFLCQAAISPLTSLQSQHHKPFRKKVKAVETAPQGQFYFHPPAIVLQTKLYALPEGTTPIIRVLVQMLLPFWQARPREPLYIVQNQRPFRYPSLINFSLSHNPQTPLFPIWRPISFVRFFFPYDKNLIQIYRFIADRIFHQILPLCNYDNSRRWWRLKL